MKKIFMLMVLVAFASSVYAQKVSVEFGYSTLTIPTETSKELLYTDMSFFLPIGSSFFVENETFIYIDKSAFEEESYNDTAISGMFMFGGGIVIPLVEAKTIMIFGVQQRYYLNTSSMLVFPDMETMLPSNTTTVYCRFQF